MEDASKIKSVRQLAIMQGVLGKLTDSLVEEDYEATLEGGWMTEDSFESREFRNFSEEGKRIYALAYAVNLAHDKLEESPRQFLKNYGDDYGDILDLSGF